MLFKNILSTDAYKLLKETSNASLIDVRSINEWINVGLPDLLSLNKKTYLIEWPLFITKLFLKDFKEKINLTFKNDQVLIFICRSGYRSSIASQIACEVNFLRVYNVRDGYEGSNINEKGWLESNLPTNPLNQASFIKLL